MLKSKAEQCPDHLRKEDVSSVCEKVTSLGDNPQSQYLQLKVWLNV